MSEYPAYIEKILTEARLLLEEDDFSEPDAAALCFDVLALFPECQEASDLILEAFRAPDLIRENRKALGRVIDEWDDRPWQQRRRLARSYGYMSRWEGQYRKYDETVDPEDLCPSDVKTILEEGEHQLIQDYLLGQSQGREMAWPIFQEAIKRTANPAVATFWVAQTYAEQGYFAESVSLFEELLAQYPKHVDARRLGAEVRWWRDHQEQIPWLPTYSDENGRLWQQTMRETDEDFAANEALYTMPIDHYHAPDAAKLPSDFVLPTPLSADVIAQIEETLAERDTPASSENDAE
jgi:tetratricopeptide (TPR) repeat protein